MTDLAERRGMETEVYRPAEDSALLLDAALNQVEPDDLVLEVGTGSGFVAVKLAGETGATVLGSDVNPHACRAARDRGVDVVRADLVSPFSAGVFDVVLFNPPYLPADDRAARDDWMEEALTGGESGRAVIEPFVDTVRRVLAPEGTVLLLVSTLSDIGAVENRAIREGFRVETVASESFPFETIEVLALEPSERE
ncbi:MAG: HemK2/MTQ2 family protein methyltransferase [Halodesulfurarchaeum sp.]